MNNNTDNMNNNIDNYNTTISELVSKLENDGVIYIKNVFTIEQIMQMNTIYTNSWTEIKNNLPKTWHTRQYKEDCRKYDNFIGSDLYNGKTETYYKDTIIYDMQKNRYDITYNLDTIKNIITLPPIITNIMNKLLKCEYSYYYGGLPIENINQNNNLESLDYYFGKYFQ